MNTSEVRVLLVEDDRTSREMLRELLRIEGFAQIRTCASMAEAYDEITSRQFDLALLDIGLPDGSGLEVLKLLRESTNQISLPVIMLSVDSQSDAVVACIEAGANDFVAKPFDVTVLMARIRNLLLIRQLDEDVNIANERYSLAAKGANDGLWDWYIITGEIFLSQRWKKLLGVEDEHLENHFSSFIDRVHSDDIIEFNRALRNHLDGVSEFFEQECRMQHKDGAFRWMLIRGAAIRYENGKAYRMAGSMTDITRRKVIDPLTNILNRSAFLDKLDLLIDAREQQIIRSFSVVTIAINRFKMLNDSYGHHFCDRLVVEIANHLGKIVPASESYARISSDKFAFTMQSGMSEEELIKWVKESLVKPLKVPLVVNERELHVTFSAGLLHETSTYKYSHDMLRDADIALHQAMQKGESAVTLFKSGLEISLKDRLELEEDLFRAIENNEFRLFFQPKVNPEGNIVGAEALVRWYSERRGMVSPAEFIPIAEETGLIIPLGSLLFSMLCRHLAEWKKQSLNTKVAFNLSGKQFMSASLTEEIRTEMEFFGLSPADIELEVTESTIMSNITEAAQILHNLVSDGFTIAIDDFGTGYSSLAYLKSLPFHTLKIDKSFVDDLPDGGDDKAIVSAIVSIAKAMNFSLVAEGVEECRQFDYLKELGVNNFQGYFFYKPMADMDYCKLLQEQASK